MKAMRSNAPRRVRSGLVVVLSAAVLTSCAPKPPSGVDERALIEAIGEAIGDPGTCVVLAQAKTGKVIWQYQALTQCSTPVPSCEGSGIRTTDDLARATALGGPSVRSGCQNVSWASGPTPRADVIYAAMMQGKRAMPGIVMADRLDQAFKDTGF